MANTSIVNSTWRTVLCPRCGLYVEFATLDGLPTTLEMHPATRRQIVQALTTGQDAFKKVVTHSGPTGYRFTVLNVPLLARFLYDGGALDALGYSIHLEHPHQVTALAKQAKAYTGRNLPLDPPY